MLSLQRTRIQSLVGELRSQKPRGVAKTEDHYMYIYKENTERNGTSEALINDHTRQHKAIKAVPNKEDARGSAHLSMQHRPQPVQLISAYHLPGRTCSSLPPSSCSEAPANHTQ